MAITLKQLRVFACVAKHLNLTHAANELFLTQPAVSNLIKQLENHFELPLLEFHGKKMQLTPAGKRVTAYYEQVDAVISELEQEVATLKDGVAGLISIALESSAKYFIPKAIHAMQVAHPQLEVRLHFTTRQQVLAALKDNTCDFAIVSQLPEDLAVDTHYLRKNPLVFVAAAEHPLTQRESLTIKDLQQETILVRETRSGIRLVTEQLFVQAGIKPKLGMELSSTEAIKQAVIANIGIAIIPLISAQLELATQLLKILPLAHFPLDYHWYAITTQNRRPSRLTQQVIAFLSQQVEG